MSNRTFPNLKRLAKHIRDVLGDKKCFLIFAYNGVGKTRLSCEFKDLGKKAVSGSGEPTADTLYYNAFTEDLFTWNNDLDDDTNRVLQLNKNSRFLEGTSELEMESRIRQFLDRYADFEFEIDYVEGYISFSREIELRGTITKVDNIKISRGEENIFIWCFFLAIAQLAIDNDPAYNWVKYIYIDDPISSLDDNNAVAVACQLVNLFQNSDMKVVISTHHALFFNVLYNEFGREGIEKRFLFKNSENGKYIIRNTGDTPFFHHVALLKELIKAVKTGKLYTYHFNVLRSILEKTASFHGFDRFSECIKKDPADLDGTIHARMVNLFSHGGYSILEPVEMVEDNKIAFKEILEGFMESYTFNSELFDG